MNSTPYLQPYLDIESELKSFLFRILVNRADCEDVVQETYIKVSQNIDSFRGDAAFKTWVFSIALNLAKNQLQKAKRWGDDYTDICRDLHLVDAEMMKEVGAIFYTTPEANLELKEHLDYCYTCVGKTLSVTQQLCLFLKDIYGFKQDEIGAITGLSEGKVKHGIADAKRHMVKIFDNRCALISKTGICDQCTAIKKAFNPKQDAHIEANKLKMAQERDCGDTDHLYQLRLEIVRSIDPINKPSSGLHIHFLENIEKWVAKAQAAK